MLRFEVTFVDGMDFEHFTKTGTWDLLLRAGAAHGGFISSKPADATTTVWAPSENDEWVRIILEQSKYVQSFKELPRKEKQRSLWSADVVGEVKA